MVTMSDIHIETIIDELDRSEPEIDKYVLVSTLLEQLTPDEIQFIELRFFENKSFKEVGYFLGISEGNAKIRTYRILEKLRSISKQITYKEV
jgi:RNA polymerase sigma-70 factor (ECF subfamily)